MGRLTSTINAVEARGQKSLVAYIVAGDPHPDQTVDLMHALVVEGVDLGEELVDISLTFEAVHHTE